MDWLINFIRSTFGTAVASAIIFIIIGITIAVKAPKVFVTYPILAQEITPLKRNDLATEYKLIEFQRNMVLQRKWDLEDTVDKQGGRPTMAQQGRLAELTQEAESLRARAVELDRKIRECK